MAIFLALVSSAMWGTSDFYGGTLTRRLPALTVTAVSELVGLVGVVVVAVTTGAFDAPTGYIGWGLLGAVSGSIGIVAFYQALATGTMGVVAPIASLGVTIPVLAGLLQGDRPGIAQDIGIVIAVVGVVLAGGPEVHRGDRAALRPLLLAAVAAVGFGVVFVAIAHGARSSTVMTLLTMRASAVVLLVVVGTLTSTSLRVGVPDLPMLALVGAFDVGANATFAFATRHGLLSVTAVLSSLYPAITVLLARSIHAERLARIQLLGVIGAMGGVALIAS